MKYYLTLFLSLLVSCSHEAAKVDQNLLTQEKYTSSDMKHVALGEKITGDWWELFKSKELNALIQEALQNNYSIAAAKSRLSQAEHAITSAQSQFWPQVDLEGGVAREKYGVALTGPTPTKIPVFSVYSLGPTASLPLDIFGKTRNDVKQQTALAQYQYYELQAAYLTLSANVVTQVINLAVFNEQVQIVKELIAYDQKYFNLMNASLQNGSATKLDLLAAERQLNSDQSLLPTLEQQVAMAQHALAKLLGKTPASWVAPSITLNNLKLPNKLPVALPSELIHQRPDILAAEAQLHASNAAVDVAIANMFPSLSITGSLSQQSLTLGSLFKSSSTAWGIAGNVLQPIFDGGLLEAKRKSAIDAEQATLAMYQQTILNAFCQVADLLHAMDNDHESLDIQQRNMDLANSELNLANFKHNSGNSGILEVIQAKRINCNARLALQRAIMQKYLDVTQLCLALGNPTALEHL